VHQQKPGVISGTESWLTNLNWFIPMRIGRFITQQLNLWHMAYLVQSTQVYFWLINNTSH